MVFSKYNFCLEGTKTGEMTDSSTVAVKIQGELRLIYNRKQGSIKVLSKNIGANWESQWPKWDILSIDKTNKNLNRFLKIKKS